MHEGDLGEHGESYAQKGRRYLFKVGGICITVLTVVGAAVTIIGFVFAWWGPAKNHDETITDLAFAAQPETAPQPAPETPTPTPTTTVVNNTKSMLKTALSIPSSSEQSKGLTDRRHRSSVRNLTMKQP